MVKVLLMKLKSGEEIIAKELDEEEDTIKLGDVRVIVAQPQPGGQMAVGFVPWMIGAPDKDIDLAKSLIGGLPTDQSPTKEMEDAYLQQTSGIAFATSGPGI